MFYLRPELAHTRASSTSTLPIAYLEGKLFQANGQTRQRLISRTSLGNNSQLGSRAVGIARSNLDARDIVGLVGSGRSSRGVCSSLEGLDAVRPA